MAILIIMLAACNNLFGEKDSTDRCDLAIVVKDTAHKPVTGAKVCTEPSTLTRYTDEHGYAFFNGIKTGYYKVHVELGDSLTDQKNIELTKQSQASLSFKIPLETTINFTVNHIDGIPLENATVTTVPPTSSFTLDAEGHAILKIPVGKYTFLITRGPGVAEIPPQVFTYNDGNINDFEFTINRQTPVVSIKNLDMGMTHSIHDITLMAECSDFEDGILPARSVTWYSDIDGYLGYGESAFIGKMSGGEHTIMLKAKDNDGLERQCETRIVLYSSIGDSYFPLMDDGTWTYSLSPDTFEIIDYQHNLDRYILTEYSSTILTNDVHRASMIYKINDDEWYLYTVDDYFVCSHDTVFVQKTIEELKTWFSQDGASPESFDSKTRIVTEYDEKYPFLIDHIDIRMNNNIVFTTTATSTWEFTMIGGVKYQNKEYYDFTSEIDFVDMTQYSYNDVRYDAAYMTLTQNGITNNFILSKGIGITSSSNTIMNQNVQALLTNTNLTEFQDTKISSTYYFKPSLTPQSTAETGDIPQNIRETVDTLRRISPRF